MTNAGGPDPVNRSNRGELTSEAQDIPDPDIAIPVDVHAPGFLTTADVASKDDPLPVAESRPGPQPASRRRNWLAWALLLVVALVVGLGLMRRSGYDNPDRTAPADAPTLPAGR